MKVSGISQTEIDIFEKLPNLKRLCVVDCGKITNLNNLKSLEHLEAFANTSLGNNPKNMFDTNVFNKLKLKILNVSYNSYVSDISFLNSSLKVLYCADCKLDQKAISCFDLVAIVASI